jgi:hypothetical protein
MPKCQLNGFNIGSWNPAFSDQTLLSDIQVEVVESVIDGLDLANLDEPDLDILGGRNQHAMPVVVGLPEDRVKIFKTLHDTNGHFTAIRSLHLKKC